MSRQPDFYFEEINSTQDYLKALVRSDVYPLARPQWARAARQLQGRGRSGRSWLNSDGALLISCAFRVEEGGHNRQLFLPFVSIIAFASLYRVVLTRFPQLTPLLRFKWPNDLVSETVPGSYAKLAGILCEGCRNDHLIVGWGLNLTAVPSSNLLTQSATSLEDLLKTSGRSQTPSAKSFVDSTDNSPDNSPTNSTVDLLAQMLMDEFDGSIARWLKNPLALQADIIAELAPVLTSFLGKHGNLPDGRQVEACRIDERGILWVRDLATGHLEPLHSGEFMLIPGLHEVLTIDKKRL